MSPSNTRLVTGAAHLLDNDIFSDLKIKCEDHEISAHKVVVCTPSTVLYAMCTAGFQESQYNTIDLSDDTKRVVYRMVECLYRGDYQDLGHPDYQTIDKDVPDVPDGRGAHRAVLHADMFAVADKYDIAALGTVAKDKFEKAIGEVGDNGHCLDVIGHVYKTTPESNRGLRDIIVSQIQTRGSKIVTETALKSRLEEIVSTTPQFGWDVFESSLVVTSAKQLSVSENSRTETKPLVKSTTGGSLFRRPEDLIAVKPLVGRF